MMFIELVDLKRQYRLLREQTISGISQVLDGMNLFLGENVFRLEEEFAHYCDARHAVGVGSGYRRSLPCPAGRRHRPRR